jgi:hypothetical protein
MIADGFENIAQIYSPSQNLKRFSKKFDEHFEDDGEDDTNDENMSHLSSAVGDFNLPSQYLLRNSLLRDEKNHHQRTATYYLNQSNSDSSPHLSPTIQLMRQHNRSIKYRYCHGNRRHQLRQKSHKNLIRRPQFISRIRAKSWQQHLSRFRIFLTTEFRDFKKNMNFLLKQKGTNNGKLTRSHSKFSWHFIEIITFVFVFITGMIVAFAIINFNYKLCDEKFVTSA